ncbi:hypothetical protein PIB30_045630 [Stylosanthes scabra]|uniref:Protein FAR1-RELATED SEQUENCE n=1 Tax=Stylosanthes scabra TaxID=79078 RepID=A0ABU6UIC2_9FABA|nr:hypothetical protein [Stylosanthes scabra]
MHAFYDSYLHTKSSLIQFVHEYDSVLGNKEQKELEDDAAGVIPCVSSSMIEIQFQKEYTTHMFKDIQVQFLKKGDCMVQVLSRQGDMYSLTVAKQKLICDQPVTDTYMLYDYRASKLQSSVPSRQSSNASESQCAINVDLLLAPPQVSTKGRPSNRRLGAELDKSIRNATRRRKKDSTSDTYNG